MPSHAHRLPLTAKLREFFDLLREDYSDYRVARIIGVHGQSWYRIVRHDSFYKSIDSAAYPRAKEYLIKNLGWSEETLCQKLGVENLDAVLAPPTLDFHEIAQRTREYQRKKEISRNQLIRELKESDPYLRRLGNQTFADFLKEKWQTADPQMTLAINHFLDSQKAESLEEKVNPRYSEVVGLVDKYLQNYGLAQTDLIKELMAYHPLMGISDRNVQGWLSGLRMPSPKKLRLIKEYLEKPRRGEEKRFNLKYARALHQLYLMLKPSSPPLYELSKELGIILLKRKSCPKKLLVALENLVIKSYLKNKKFPLEEQVLLTLFGKEACRTFDDFSSAYSSLFSLLYKKNQPDQEKFFDEYLSTKMSDQGFLQLAKNHRIDTERLEFLLQARESLAEIKYQKGPYHQADNSALGKLDRTLEKQKEEITLKIMKNFFPNYWPSHRQGKMIIPGYQKNGYPSD